MSTRIHFKGDNVTNIMKEIDELAGYMLYDAANNEVTTYTKVENESFYHLGKPLLTDKTGERIKSKSVIVSYFDNGVPLYADVFTPDVIKTYLDKHQDVISNIKHQANENTNEDLQHRWDCVKDVIELLELAAKHNLEIRLH